MFEPDPTKDSTLFRPVEETTWKYYLVLTMALAVFLFGMALYVRQLQLGLGVTGMMQPVTWGFYIINFVFFIGISHAGTLISAILRLSQAEWRRPITRMAEVITAIVLIIGGLHPIIDLGRPDRILNILRSGRLQSPLLWDVTSITAYFAASLVYLYIPLIPDIALLRDRGRKHRWLYTFLSWGWTGTPMQWKILHRSLNIMMIVVIPIAVSVHTVISYIFAMTLQPGWHSTILGPYFVVGAIFSGIGALFIVMIVFRKVYHLEAYLKEVHFQQLSILLVVMSAIWFYFTFCEYLTGAFTGEPREMMTILYKLSGPYAFFFWGMVVCNFGIPMALLTNRKTRTVPGILVSSVAVVVGMWLERLIIVVPTLENPGVAFPRLIYIPSLTEVGVFAAAVAAFVIGFMMFAKLFPLISVWEIQEGRQTAVPETAARVQSYLPEEEATDGI